MAKQFFAHVTTWVFDLDNTLYPPQYRLFDQIAQRMTAWMQGTLGLGRSEADRLRQQYWERYGTTLAGLMAEHGIAPAPFLQAVHDIDFTVLPADPVLAAHIRALPGRKIVFTNATAPYAQKVLAARGLSGIFDAVYGVEEAGYHPKPSRAAYEAVFGADGLTPARAAMFEDDARNLLVPHDMGMRCVHIAPRPLKARHIHHHHHDLSLFLQQIAPQPPRCDAGPQSF
jgi:putative hydrolase of the HAD superfamily